MAICILAGGLSTRMGRDKARMRLGRYTLGGWIRRTASLLGLPVRLLRRDLVPRCGPLGGIYTGLRLAHGDAVLFLSCDMPFVSAELLRWTLKQFVRQRRAVFLAEGDLVGFPFVLGAEDLPVVERQLAAKAFSLQKLAAALKAVSLTSPPGYAADLLNVNTPEDWEIARARWRHSRPN